MNTKRESTIEVEVIDGQKLCAMCEGKLVGQLPNTTVRLDMGYALVRTPNGTYLIDSDGTGSCDPVEKTPSEIGICADLPGALTIGAQWNLPVSQENVKALPIITKMNLAFFIRTFGGRLESNFTQWNNFLTSEMKKEPVTA